MRVGGQQHTPTPRERPGSHCTGGWVGPRVENLAPTRIWSPDHPARSESLYRLSYPGPQNIPYSVDKKYVGVMVTCLCLYSLMTAHIKNWKDCTLYFHGMLHDTLGGDCCSLCWCGIPLWCSSNQACLTVFLYVVWNLKSQKLWFVLGPYWHAYIQGKALSDVTIYFVSV